MGIDRPKRIFPIHGLLEKSSNYHTKHALPSTSQKKNMVLQLTFMIIFLPSETCGSNNQCINESSIIPWAQTLISLFACASRILTLKLNRKNFRLLIRIDCMSRDYCIRLGINKQPAAGEKKLENFIEINSQILFVILHHKSKYFVKWTVSSEDIKRVPERRCAVVT